MKQIPETRFTIIPLLILALLLSSSCSKETFKTLSDLAVLRDAITKAYKTENVDVKVQGDALGISFINTSFNSLGEQERAGKAAEIALFAKNNYPAINSVNRIWVSFIAAKNYIIFNYSNSLGVYVFEKERLSPKGYAADNGEKSVVTVSYDRDNNKTDLYLSNNLEVYSAPGSNIMLFTHLSIAGADGSAPRRMLPKTVVFDFYASSDKRMFADNPPTTIYSGDQKIFSGNARTTRVLGSNAEKSVNEFISLELPYNQFVQLTQGDEGKLIMGSKELKLTASHIQAFRAMKRCVEELKCQ